MKEPSLRMVPIILVMLRDLEMIGVAGNLALGLRDITKDNFHSDNNSIVINSTPPSKPKPKTHFDEAIIQFSDTFTWASKISRQRGGKRPNSNTDMIQAKPMFSVETISLFGLKCRDWPIIIRVFFQLQQIHNICWVLGVGRDKPSHNAIFQLY